MEEIVGELWEDIPKGKLTVRCVDGMLPVPVGRARAFREQLMQTRFRNVCTPLIPHDLFGNSDELTAVAPPNRKAMFVLQQMTNTVVSGGGIDTIFVRWSGIGTSAQVQDQGPYEYPGPNAGGTSTIPGGHGNVLHQGLVYDGCQTGTPYTVGIATWLFLGEVQSVGSFSIVVNTGVEIGKIGVSDVTTLDQAGFYTFDYTVRGVHDGHVSDVGVSGYVQVICTNDTFL